MKQKSYAVAIAFFITILIKNISFEAFYCNRLPYQSILISIASAMFLSSFVFITKNRIWTFCLSIFIDLWIIANMFYFRANNLLITIDSIFMAGNLNSYLSSLKAYLCWSMLIPPATTILYVIAYKFLGDKNRTRQFIPFALCLLFSIAFNIGGKYERWEREMKEYGIHIDFYISNGGSTTEFGQDHLYGKYGYKLFLPYSYAFQLAKWNLPIDDYMQMNDITSFFPATIVYYLSKADYSAKELDKKTVEPYINKNYTIDTQPKYNLLIVLCESLESWLFEPINGVETMTNTKNFINKHNGLFFSKIKSQAMHGVSGDGQMTVCTGLLPIQNGAACLSFASNKYPDFASYFTGSTVITPDCGWNQANVSGSYGFKNYTFCTDGHWADDSIMIKTTEIIKNLEHPFCCLSVTFSMHSPFNYISNRNFNIPDNLPKYMDDYLNCAHYTDSCLNILYSYLEDGRLLDSTIVVITGDHTIFKSQMLSEFHDAAQKYGISIADGNNYCPLIILSPEFTNARQIDDLCYQMDIFPTICNLIGYDNFYWKGFGVNLLDSTALKHRVVTEDEAYQLSDRIIKSNFDIKSYATSPF
ncbi:MAG: sulfatase-like hydrolase/transferase [Paludibacteraceae bacterium]|nr:sulfatase-like hydrolase/transferase [Paludibacteraceae bacterium]